MIRVSIEIQRYLNKLKGNKLIQRRWLSPKDLEHEYAIMQNTQSKLRMKRLIPYSKIGKFIRYDRRKIDEWFEVHEIIGVKNVK